MVQQHKSGLIVDVSISRSIRQTRARAHALGIL